MKDLILLLNPSAGVGKSLRRKDRIERLFKTSDFKYDLYISKSEEDLKIQVRQFIDEYKTIICVGGDTTYKFVATEVLEKKIPVEDSPNLGFLGAGSANDISHSLGVYEIEALLDSIKNSRIKRMDVGCVKVNSEEQPLYFLGGMSLGLGTTVNIYIEEFTRRHKYLSKNLFLLQNIGGPIAIFNSFLKNKVPMSIDLKFDKAVEEVFFSILVFLNTNRFARGLKLSPETSAFDGQIDCIAVRTSSFLETLQFHQAVKKGSHRDKKEFQIMRSDRFLINPGKKIDIQMDGEVTKDVEECEVSVLPEAIKVFVK